MIIKAIITDIEGTTSSIDFVHQTLFPYARARLREYLKTHGAEAAVREQVEAVRKETGRVLSLDEAATVLEQWMAEDKKITPLKILQGLIWREGYQGGELTGHVYEDAEEYLERWHASGHKLYVYSSGSEEAQKLIFGNTEYGDLTPLFSGYFDTRIGPKREAESYRRIVEKIGVQANEALFLSDIGEELDAARAAGMQTCQLIRDDKAKPFPAHPQARSFAEVQV